MARSVAKSARHAGLSPLAPAETPWRGLTRFAFILTILLVVIRATISEVIRSDVQSIPGTTAAPATPGPATGLVLDLLFCLPAFLILTRRLVDSTFSLRLGKSHLVMFFLAAWTMLSVCWASDKFIASVSAAHWAASLVLLWSASQLVHSWMRLRIVAGVAFGLLLIMLVQGYYYRFVDLPDLRREWNKDRAELLAQRGVDPSSTEGTQIGVNIKSGEVTGFSLSRNTYAAVLVLLGIISAGVAVQRLADKDALAWTLPIFLALALALLMLYLFVESKTAYATPFIAAILLMFIARRRAWIAAHARRLYFWGMGAFVLGVGAVVGHGLKHGNLFQLSLTYRWQYWVGAARLFIHHPWLGVGWENFGESYLAYRLPQAVEEPKDPHNFLVRAFVELGVLGGVLMIAWMLRFWWEVTQLPIAASDPRPAVPGDFAAGHRKAMLLIIGFPILAIAANALVAIDWSQRWEWVILELFKRAMFLLVLIGGLGVVVLRSFADQRLDDRPARWLLWSILVAVGLFLVHNLIDFSLFEPGPLALFALFAGGALGMRLPVKSRFRGGTPAIIATFILGGVAWVVAAAAGAWNVALAEGLAQDADQQIRANNPTAAVQKLIEAGRLVPINPDYAFRAAMASSTNTLMTREMLLKAVNADPTSAMYHRFLAHIELLDKDPGHAMADYNAAVSLDPNNMGLRIEYAQALVQNHQAAQARIQYQKTLELNDQLPPQELQRLGQTTVNDIRAHLASP